MLLRFWDPGLAELSRYGDRDFVRAWQAVHGAWWPPLGPELSAGNRLPGPFLYLGMGTVLLFGGGDPRALVVAAGLANLGALLLCYFAIRSFWGRRVARIAALLLATLPVHYVQARLAWNPTFGMPAAAGAFYLLARMWKSGLTPARALGAGVLVSLAGQSHAAYFTLIVALLYGGFALARQRGAAFVLAGLVIPLLPFLSFLVSGSESAPAGSGLDGAYYYEVRTQPPGSPMEALIRGGIVDFDEWKQKVGSPPVVNLNAFAVAVDHIVPNASERRHEFRWLSRAQALLNYGAWGPWWRVLQWLTAALFLAAAAVGAVRFAREESRRDARVFFILWGVLPLLPIFALRYAYFATPDEGGGFWPVGTRHYLPALPFLTTITAMGIAWVGARTDRARLLASAALALATLCGVLINGAWRVSDIYLERIGGVKRLSLRDKMALSDDLICGLGLSIENVRARVVDRSLLAIEDDFFYPLLHAAAHCPSDTSHTRPTPGACLALDLPQDRWADPNFWPVRISHQVIEGATRLTLSDLTPILQTGRYTISTYEREPCLRGNVINGYFSDERDPDRPDAAWRRRR